MPILTSYIISCGHLLKDAGSVIRNLSVFFKRAVWVTLLCALSFTTATAQNSYSVSGTIFSPEDQQPLPGATAIVLSATDSSMIAGTTTDPDGYFVVKELSSDNYILKITYVGHNSMYKSFQVEGRSLGLGMMLLKPSSTQLQAVEVVATRAKLKQVGDTTVYFASAVNVGYDATAQQLINKMAGIQARNGVLKAQGEDILEITVDGKRFFEGDLETALKMLPAESVQNVEVFNYQNERSRLTGIDEGSDGKVINIVTKEEFRRSAFGRGYVGAGPEGEYQGGGNLNLMNDDQRLTLLFQTNNINQQNFAQEDVSEISGAATSQQDGISTVQAGGVDFSTSLGENTEVSGTYLFNSSHNHSESELVREYVANPMGDLQYFENGNERSTATSHDINLRLQHDVNDRNSITFQPSLHLNDHRTKRAFDSEMFGNDTLLSESASSLNGIGGGINFMAPVNYSHRFKKRGRTLSADLTPAYNKNSGESDLISEMTLYNEFAEFDSIRQNSNAISESKSLTAGLHYSEPLSKKSTIFLHVRSQLTNDVSDERVYKDGVSIEENTIPDSLLSNKFESRITSHSIQPEYHFRTGNHHFKVGIDYNLTLLNSDQLFPDQIGIERQYSAWLPNAMWRVNLNKGRRLNMNYRSSNRAPSAHQLQTVPDNSNPMRQYAGNEDLQQELRHSVTANYYANNFDKGSVFMLGFNLSVVDNFYGTTVSTAASDTTIDDRIFLKKGGQLIRTENMNGYFMAGIYTSIDRDLNFLKSSLTTGLSLNHSKMPGVINGQTNWASSRSAEFNLGLNSNISKEIDFDITSTTSYETVRYSLQKAITNNLIRQETKFSLQWVIWHGLTFSSDVQHLILRGNEEYFNRNILLCNLGLGYKFLKNKQAEFRITVFDLFNNNSSVRRLINEVYTDNYTNNVLNRYTMLTFTYRLKSGNSGN